MPWVDAHYRTLAESAYRGICGKSSGGYGAIVTPMLRPDLWGGLATYVRDALFETCYFPDCRTSVRTLRDHYEGSLERFWTEFRAHPAFSLSGQDTILNDYCMAACYSADPDGMVPYDTATSELTSEIWERRLAWGPVRMVPRYAAALRGMRAIYIDSRTRDQFFLDMGAEAFRGALEGIGITNIYFELFHPTHSAIEYRYPLRLRYLAERLQP